MTVSWESIPIGNCPNSTERYACMSTADLASMKLLSKERDGKKMLCVYDPAKTPLQRLLQLGILPIEKQQELTEVVEVLDPIGLFNQLKQLQQAVFRSAAGCSPFVSSPLAEPLHVFSVEQCTVGKLPAERNPTAPSAGLEALCREQERRKRVLGWRRTHKDPFAGEWEHILSWLVSSPEREPRRHFPGTPAPLSRTLSATADPHLAARDAKDPGLSAGKQGGAVAGRSDPGVYANRASREGYQKFLIVF
jgi:hypothetical protein